VVSGGESKGEPYNFGDSTKIGRQLDILNRDIVGELTEENGVPMLKL